MALTKLQKDVCITMIDCALIFLITVFHFISFFFFKSSDFTEIFDTYDSSPLFDFSISDNCGYKSSIVFHKWKGIDEEYRCYDKEEENEDEVEEDDFYESEFEGEDEE